MEKKTFYYLNIAGVIPVESEDGNAPLRTEDGYDIGVEFADIQAGKFILLTQQQADFYTEHPTASIEEVWNCALTPPPVLTLEEVKAKKIEELMIYDSSDAVNQFLIIAGEQTIPQWLPRDMRLALKDRLQRELAAGIALGTPQEEIMSTISFGLMKLTLPTLMWLGMLDVVMAYADHAFDVTNDLYATVMGEPTVQAVNAHVFDPEKTDPLTLGYPPKPQFPIPTELLT